MRAEAYDLSVDCDAPGCTAQRNFIARNSREARRKARAAGWTVGPRASDTPDFCPKHRPRSRDA